MIQDFDNVEAILGVAAVREPPLRATLAEVATVSPTAELYGTRIKSESMPPYSTPDSGCMP